MERTATYEKDLNLEATELRLGLPGIDEPEKQSSSASTSAKYSKKRTSSEMDNSSSGKENEQDSAPAPK